VQASCWSPDTKAQQPFITFGQVERKCAWCRAHPEPEGSGGLEVGCSKSPRLHSAAPTTSRLVIRSLHRTTRLPGVSAVPRGLSRPSAAG
jgi:hypothetical protein